MELPTVQRVYSKAYRSPYTVEYTGVEQDESEYDNHTAYGEVDVATGGARIHITKKRSLWRTLLHLLFTLLWLGPVLFLLYVNLHGLTIGAGAWCPGGNCNPDTYDPASSVAQARLAKLDHDNHDLLGALQFAAKGLEIWFIIIVTWLVYSLTILLASRSSGLQLAYLTRPSEFSEIPGLFDPLLWKTLPALRRSKLTAASDARRGPRLLVWAFVLFTIGLCILCNLIGPAVAVLVIPSLQWKTTPRIGSEMFVAMLAGDTPSLASSTFSYGCSADDMSAGRWSCAGWNRILDGWLASCLSGGAFEGATSSCFTNQATITFAANGTDLYEPLTHKYSNPITWAPNRQLLADLNNDVWIVSQIGSGHDSVDSVSSDYYDTFKPYNDTLQTYIHRDGPVLGAMMNMWLGYNNQSHYDVQVNSTSWLRCYEDYDLSHVPTFSDLDVPDYTFTKCVTIGDGWGDGFMSADFTVLGEYKPWIDDFGPSINVEVYTSGKAAFLANGQVPDGFDVNCLPNGQVPDNLSCDWDLFFSIDPNDTLYNLTRMVTTVHMTTNSAPLAGYPDTVDFAVDFVTTAAMTDYSVDPGPLSNPLTYTTLPSLPAWPETYVSLDPNWILAAWGVDAQGTLGANASSTVALNNILTRLWSSYGNASASDPIDALYPDIDYVSLIPVAHALSLVGYYTDATVPANTPPTFPDADPQHLALNRHAQILVWAYGMSSRTAYVGVVVASLACVVVVGQAVLGLVQRSKFLSPTQLLVAALEYGYAADFAGMERDEGRIAKVPFRVDDDHHHHGGGGGGRSRAGEFRLSKTV